jgi:hypothetical protein
VGHEPASSTLEIEFTTREIYRYLGVPIKIHAELMKAESHGTYFNQQVRDIYPYKRLT